jgi:hypothetical protein
MQSGLLKRDGARHLFEGSEKVREEAFVERRVNSPPSIAYIKRRRGAGGLPACEASRRSETNASSKHFFRVFNY